MLKKSSFLAEACDIVYSHQEHFKRERVSRGLKGGRNTSGARIFSSPTRSTRLFLTGPYRPARTLAEARTEIKDWTGRSF